MPGFDQGIHAMALQRADGMAVWIARLKPGNDGGSNITAVCYITVNNTEHTGFLPQA